jgi:hypothetical protein
MERVILKQIRDPTTTPDTLIIGNDQLTISQCAHEVLLKISLSKKRKKSQKACENKNLKIT